MVLGGAAALALAGCHGVTAQLASSGSGSGSGSGGSSSAVQAAGPVSGGSGALRVLAEPQAGVSELYRLINGAKSSVDLTMYELKDQTAESDLAADAKRGVDVRVILDSHLEKSSNTATYDYLSAHRVHVTWAPSGTTYHQKTLTVDGKTSVVMTLNMVAEDYAGTRDFAVIDTSKADITAIVATFNADFAHKKITPPDGADLVWSPTNSQAAILAVINSAKHTLAVENEEMGDTVITKDGRNVYFANRGDDFIYAFTADAETGALTPIGRTTSGGKVPRNFALDPTELNRQGPDEGTQYRSVIFYGNEEQKKIADAYIAQLDQAKVFPRPVVTQVVPLKAFYPAEAYHQNYATLHPNQPYIVFNDAPKVAHLRQEFPDLYTGK